MPPRHDSKRGRFSVQFQTESQDMAQNQLQINRQQIIDYANGSDINIDQLLSNNFSEALILAIGELVVQAVENSNISAIERLMNHGLFSNLIAMNPDGTFTFLKSAINSAVQFISSVEDSEAVARNGVVSNLMGEIIEKVVDSATGQNLQQIKFLTLYYLFSKIENVHSREFILEVIMDYSSAGEEENILRDMVLYLLEPSNNRPEKERVLDAILLSDEFFDVYKVNTIFCLLGKEDAAIRDSQINKLFGHAAFTSKIKIDTVMRVIEGGNADAINRCITILFNIPNFTDLDKSNLVSYLYVESMENQPHAQYVLEHPDIRNNPQIISGAILSVINNLHMGDAENNILEDALSSLLESDFDKEFKLSAIERSDIPEENKEEYRNILNYPSLVVDAIGALSIAGEGMGRNNS